VKAEEKKKKKKKKKGHPPQTSIKSPSFSAIASGLLSPGYAKTLPFYF
jgi:hypothetical protein